MCVREVPLVPLVLVPLARVLCAKVATAPPDARVRDSSEPGAPNITVRSVVGR